MKNKRIKLIKNKKIFKMKPLFDDSDIYEEKKEDDEDINLEQLEKEIDELAKEILKN